MSNTHADPVQQIKDQLHAIEKLLLAHISACDSFDRRVTLETVHFGRDQITSLVEQGRNPVAIRLKAMLEDIEEFFD